MSWSLSQVGSSTCHVLDTEGLKLKSIFPYSLIKALYRLKTNCILTEVSFIIQIILYILCCKESIENNLKFDMPTVICSYTISVVRSTIIPNHQNKLYMCSLNHVSLHNSIL